jgi:transposase
LVLCHSVKSMTPIWESIEPYLPPQKSYTGRPRADMRKLINGILYVVTTGCTWKDVPQQYSSIPMIKFNAPINENLLEFYIINALINENF